MNRAEYISAPIPERLLIRLLAERLVKDYLREQVPEMLSLEQKTDSTDNTAPCAP